MDKSLLIKGGTSYGERLEDALRRADITQDSCRKDPLSARRKLVGNRLFMPLYVDWASSYDARWADFFRMVENTEGFQNIEIRKNDLFPRMKGISILKTCYLLPAKRWRSQKEKLSAREAVEEALSGFTLEDVKKVADIPVGFDFKGNGHFKVGSPYNKLRARALYEKRARQATVRIHIGKDDFSEALRQGILIEADNVPSLSGENGPYTVTIGSVPVYFLEHGFGEKAKAVSYEIFNSDVECGRKNFSEYKFGRRIKAAFGKTKRSGREDEFDHHPLFVLDAASDIIKARYPGLAIDNPFPEVRNGVEDFVEAAYKRIVVTREDATPRKIMLWQSVALMQVCTMMAVGYLNMKEKGLFTA